MTDTCLIRRLITLFPDPTIYRQISSVVTEAERELEAMIRIQRALDKFLVHMEPFLVIVLNKRKIPLISGDTAEQTVLFEFLQNPQTPILESIYETAKCSNQTLDDFDAAEMDLFMRVVSLINIVNQNNKTYLCCTITFVVERELKGNQISRYGYGKLK